ncbi:hypothetical protein KA017_03355 [Candidatus Woesebacteria bacterium]|nr:hypothetical protein [Candidatus Woesebacteria bacterium]
MVNQELVVYIAQQLEAGVTEPDIRKSLMQSGWQETAVSEAFAFLQPIAAEPIAEAKSRKSLKKTALILLIVALLLLFVGGAIYAFNQFMSKPVEPVATTQFASPEPVVTETDAQQNEIEDTSNTQEQTMEEQLDQLTKELLVVATKIGQNITSCTPTKLEFTHIFDGKKYIKEIVGRQEDKCYYTESMPNNGKLDCYFSDQQTQAIAEYTNKLVETTTIESATHVDLGPDESSSQTVEKLDGVEVINPWNTALQDGSCVVSGY